MNASVRPEERALKAAAPASTTTSPTIRCNVVEHPSRVLVKRYLLVDGALTKDMSDAGRIPAGCVVSTKTMSFTDYVTSAFNGGPHTYVLPSNSEIGCGVPLRTKSSQGPGVDRSADTMKFVPGQPAVCTFDYDPNPRGPQFRSPEELWDILCARFAEAFSGAACGSYFSSSSFLASVAGEQISGARGYHLAAPVPDAGDIDRFGKALFKRLWLAGFGYMFIARDGGLHPRTVFDLKVLEPQQPLFAGGAHCEKGVVQNRPLPTVRDGSYLDTSKVLTLSSKEEVEYEVLLAAARASAEAEAAKVRERYVEEEVARLTAGGTSRTRSIHLVEARFGGVLRGSDELTFADHGVVTVATTLADPGRFDKCYLHDPIEPEYGGPSTAIFFANTDSGKPRVFSYAHHGRSFLLKHDEISLKARFEAMDSTDLALCWDEELLNSELPDDAQGRLLGTVKTRTHTPLRDLRARLKSRVVATRLGRSGAAPDPGTEIARWFLDRRYPRAGASATLIYLESGAFWGYTGTHWRPVADSVLHGELQAFAESTWDGVCQLYDAQRKMIPGMSVIVASATAALKNLTVVAGDPLRFLDSKSSAINLSNGELWLTDKGRILRPHSPESFLTSCASVPYDPGAKAPGFEAALRGLLCEPGGLPFADQDEMLRHVLELLGYVIQTSRDLKVFYLFVGPGDNGKTQLSRLVAHIIGEDAIAFDRLSAVGEDSGRFATNRLQGKQALIDDDAEHEMLLPDGLLKKISEKKPMTGELKFGGHFTFIASVVVMILANSWPRTRDLSRGMRTRAQVIYLPRQFRRPGESSENDPDIQRPEVWRRVFESELSGVVNLLIEGYYRLRERGAFLPPPSAVAAFEMWMASANPVSRFMADTCDRLTGLEANRAGPTTSVLFGLFLSWADENNVRQTHRPQLNNFKARIEQLDYKVKHTSGGTAVYGLRLKEEWALRTKEVWFDPWRPVGTKGGALGARDLPEDDDIL